MPVRKLSRTSCPRLLRTLVIDDEDRPLQKLYFVEESKETASTSTPNEERSASVYVDRYTSSLIIKKDNLDGHKLSDLQVTLSKERKVLKISGRHEETVKVICPPGKTFSEEFGLPDDTDFNDIESCLDENGSLVVTIPKLQPEESSSSERILPIEKPEPRILDDDFSEPEFEFYAEERPKNKHV